VESRLVKGVVRITFATRSSQVPYSNSYRPYISVLLPAIYKLLRTGNDCKQNNIAPLKIYRNMAPGMHNSYPGVYCRSQFPRIDLFDCALLECSFSGEGVNEDV
jgi:hypothetical protein